MPPKTFTIVNVGEGLGEGLDVEDELGDGELGDGELGDGLLVGALEGDFALEFFFAPFDFTEEGLFFTREVSDFFDFPAFFCPASKDGELKKKLIAKMQTPNLQIVTPILLSN